MEINECERYAPCGAKGSCLDRIADYECECEAGWGGKNCSVELTGCNEVVCLNSGTCSIRFFLYQPIPIIGRYKKAYNRPILIIC